MKHFEHFVITRFNVELEFSNGRHRDDVWLKHRLSLFQRYCVPSIRGQSNTNFTWLVMVDSSTDEKYILHLREIIGAKINKYNIITTGPKYLNTLRAHLAKIKSAAATHLITTRVDNDDALHTDFVKFVQAEFKLQNFEFIEFKNGYTFDPKREEVRMKQVISNPFASLVEELDQNDIFTVFCADHRYLARHGKLRSLDVSPMWLQLIHDRNACNKLEGALMRYDESALLLKEFNLGS